jgi:cold shock CspA family protein
LCLVLLLPACDESAPEGQGTTESDSFSAVAEPGSARFDFVTFSRLQAHHEGVPCAPERPSPLASAARIVAELRQSSDHALLICVDDVLQQTGTVTDTEASDAGADARAEVLLEAMAAAKVDIYVPGHGDLLRFGVDGLLDRTAALGIPVLISNIELTNRDDVEPYRLLTADGITVAIMAAIPLMAKGSSSEPGVGVKILKPMRYVKQLSKSLLDTGKADMVVLFSALSNSMNQKISDGSDVHFIIGSNELGQSADNIIRRTGCALMSQRFAGSEAGHTTLNIANGNFSMIDLSPVWSMPVQLAKEWDVIEQWLEQYETNDVQVLAQRISPTQEPDLLARLDMREQNEQWLREFSTYEGSYIAHRRAEFAANQPGDPVLAVLARQASSIQSALDALAVPITPLDPASYISDPNTCVECHRDQFAHWEATDHSRGHSDLEPLGRGQDGSCLICHAVGFNKGGGFTDPRHGAPYGSVSCMTCHDTRSFHATLKRGAVDPPLSGITDWDYVSAKCEPCHNNRRSPGFDLELAMQQTACPPMRPDDPDLARARRQAIKAIERNREEGTSNIRDVYREGRALIGLSRVEEGVLKIVEYAESVLDQNSQTVEICRYLDEHGASHEALDIVKVFLAGTPSDPMANTEYVRLLLEATVESAQDPILAESWIRRVAPDDGSDIKYVMVPLRKMQVEALFRVGNDFEAFKLLHRLKSSFSRDDTISEFVDEWLAKRG